MCIKRVPPTVRMWWLRFVMGCAYNDKALWPINDRCTLSKNVADGMHLAACTRTHGNKPMAGTLGRVYGNKSMATSLGSNPWQQI